MSTADDRARSVALGVGLLVAVAACAPSPAPASAPTRAPSPGQAETPPLPTARILVLGDIQLGNAFKQSPSLSTWEGARLDTTELAARLGEALRDTRPTHLIQTGDLVDLNESAVLETVDASGQRTARGKQPLEEWRPVLALFPAEPRLFPTVGNHERYGELLVSAGLLPDGDSLELRGLKLTKSLTSHEVHAAMLAHFPHLAGDATFHGDTGSYAVTFARFCLVSFDGADLHADPTLFDFLDARLAACDAAHVPALVVNHYPLFSGRPRADDPSLELHADRERLLALFARHGVALVLSGHEHFYLRYLALGRQRAGYEPDLPARPVYMTVSDFANPYGRSLERLDPTDAAAANAFRYFKGTHYAEVVVDDAGVHVTVRGYRPTTATWEAIDTFDLGR